MKTIAKKSLQFYMYLTEYFCYLDSGEILCWLESKGLIYVLLCEDFVKFDV